MFGQVVGITSAALVGGENLNFAIPINDVKSRLKLRSGLQRFPDEPESDAGEDANAQDPIILDEDGGATGFAEVFAIEPFCAGLTLTRDPQPDLFSGGKGYWILSVKTMHEVDKYAHQVPNGRTFLSWWAFSHYTGKQHDCTIAGERQSCSDVDSKPNVYALINADRDADAIPNYCLDCTTSTPASVHAAVKAVCVLVKGGGGGKVK